MTHALELTPGPELDERIARAIAAWQPEQPCDGQVEETPEGWSCPKCGATGSGDPLHDEAPMPYSTNLAAAWDVMVALRDRFDIVVHPPKEGGSVTCHVRVLATGAQLSLEAPTPPLAVCRAVVAVLEL